MKSEFDLNYVFIILQIILSLLFPKFNIIVLILKLVSVFVIYFKNKCEKNHQRNLFIHIIISFLIHFLTREITKSHEESFGDSKTTITLGIPCIPPDVKKLDNLVKNINEQEVLPTNIIIRLSETTKKDAQKIESRLNKISDCKVIIDSTTNKAYAGINRNRIAEISNSDYISFIDADDLMHPQRLKVIQSIIDKNPGIVGVAHGFIYGKPKPDGVKHKFDNLKYEVWDGKKFWKYHKDHPPQSRFFFPDINIHHGHPTYKRSVFKDVKFSNRSRGQDAEMLRNVVEFYGDNSKNIHYTPDSLTVYLKRPKIYNS